MRRSDLKAGDDDGNIKQKPWDDDRKTKPQKPRWIERLLNIIGTIFSPFNNI